MLLREHVVQTATLEDEFRGSILSILWGKVISKIKKRQIEYPVKQIIEAVLQVLTEDMGRTAVLTGFCLPRLWVRQSLWSTLCIMGSVRMQRYPGLSARTDWGTLLFTLKENLCSWTVCMQYCTTRSATVTHPEGLKLQLLAVTS